MWKGEIVAIYLGDVKAEPMRLVPEARAVAGEGLSGDRYFKGAGTYSDSRPDRQVTLIESEAVESAAHEYGVPIDPAETRRNLVTRGVALNHLVGREFTVGGVKLRGLRLCEPCKHLEALTRPGVRKALVHRGGLRAEILEGGVLRAGDDVAPA